MDRRSGRRTRVVGLDEVGRGPLAGPVVVCAVEVRGAWRPPRAAELGALRDSKKLTANRREAWHAYLTRHPDIRYVLARVYPNAIDRTNIARAANLAAWRAYIRLMAGKRRRPAPRIYLDGGLFLKDKGANRALRARTNPRSDERVPQVAMASIIAKVARDRYMARLARKHPGYGFERHKGYGTRAHFAAIRRFGPTPAHRISFIS